MAKVQVMAERIRQINPPARSRHRGFPHVGQSRSIVGERFDYIIDCIDGFRTKARLIAWCRRNRLPLVTVGGAGGQTDPTRIRVADLSRTEHDALFSKTRKLLRSDYGFPENLKRRFRHSLRVLAGTAGIRRRDGGISPEKPSANRGRAELCRRPGLRDAVTAASDWLRPLTC